MSISSITSGFTATYQLLQTASEEKALFEQARETSEANASSKTTSVGSDILALLSKVPKGDDGKLSFQDVKDYREELSDAWDEKVMADLEKLGVDVSGDLSMSYDAATGKVTVADGVKGKEIIDKYFEDNPDVVGEFYDIVQLGKLTATADSKLSQTQYAQSLKLQSMAWWYQDNISAQSWFDGGGLLAMQGTTSYTGLNLMV